MADFDIEATAQRVATGVLPVDAEWHLAAQAFDIASLEIARLDAVDASSAPSCAIREAVNMLGSLLAVWHGYGESTDG